MIESRNATWIRDWAIEWAIEWSTNHGELWISRIRRSVDGWTRTVTFDARPTGADVERVAALVERMPAVEATIEIPSGGAASAGIRVTHSEALEPPIAEISALVVQLPRCSMRIEIARVSNDKDAPEAPAPNELTQATAALVEARAKCDELRGESARLRDQLLRLGLPAREALDAGDCELLEEAARRVVSERDSAQATLDEALRVQGAIWDAVGGQRDGESLVDAVRRAVGTRSARSFPKPERVEARQWWAFEEPAIGPVRLVATGEKITMGELETGEPVRLRTADLLADPRWRYLGNGERPIGAGAPGSIEPHPLADAIAGLSIDEIAALSAAGWVMRWTAPSMRWVTPGGAALDPATWRETLRREAARLAGKRYVVGVDGEKSEEAKMASKECDLSDSMSSMRRLASVAAAADSEMLTSERGRHAESVDEAKAEIDRLRSVILGIGGALDHRSPEHIVDTAKRVVAERDTAYQRGQQEMRGRAAIRCARLAMKDAHWPSRRALEGASAAIHGIPIAKAPTVSASEVTGEAVPGAVSAETASAGESVARSAEDAAEIARLREQVESRIAGERRAIDNAIECAVGERDAKIAMLRRDVERLNNRASNAGNEIERWQQATDCTTPEQAEEERIDLRLRCKNAEETETVVRADRDAAAQEITRLRRELESVVAAHASESERWRAATGCESLEKARAFVARINEAAKLLRD